MIQLVDFHQEVEDIRVLDRVKVRLLGEDQTLIIVVRVLRGADGDIHDEHFARTRENHRSLRGDHAHVLVRLHYPLDSRNGEVVVFLEVFLVIYVVKANPSGPTRIGLNVVQLRLPHFVQLVVYGITTV